MNLPATTFLLKVGSLKAKARATGRTTGVTTGAAVLVLLIGIASGALVMTTVYYGQVQELNTQNKRLEQSVSTLERSVDALVAISSLPIEQVPNITYSGGLNASSVYMAAAPSVVTVQGVQVETVQGLFGASTQEVGIQGSGFVLEYNSTYYVVTNYHVIEDVTNITVTFGDSYSYPATVVGFDRYSDLAVLRTDAPPSQYHALQLANSSELQVGATVMAIGSPYGLEGSFTIGVVSATDRLLQDPVSSPYPIAAIIQTTAEINPGNSGGPLLDAAGQVVGITTAVVANSQGVGFAIPSLILSRELPFLVETGSYEMHAYLGFAVTDMNYYIAKAMNTNVTRGVLVETVVPGGPAGVAGLRGGDRNSSILGSEVTLGGDIITEVNGTVVVSVSQLLSYIELNVLPGESLQFTVVRGAQTFNLSVVAGYRPG